MKKSLFFVLFLIANVAFAQRTVTGIITDKNNIPIEELEFGQK